MYRKTEKAIRAVSKVEKEMFEAKEDTTVLNKLKELRSKLCQKLRHQR